VARQRIKDRPVSQRVSNRHPGSKKELAISSMLGAAELSPQTGSVGS
jgi:hypothetical protein